MRNKGGDSVRLFFACRQNPQAGLLTGAAPVPAVHRMLQMAAWAGSPPPSVTGLRGAPGASNWTSPSLPNIFSKPLLSQKKKRDERKSKRGRKENKPKTNACRWKPLLVCSLVELLTSSLPIGIAIYNFAGISLMS